MVTHIRTSISTLELGSEPNRAKAAVLEKLLAFVLCPTNVKFGKAGGAPKCARCSVFRSVGSRY